MLDLRSTLGPEGYAHRGDLLEAGWRPDRIRAAAARDGVLRGGRQWLLAPEAAPELHLAAATGTRVTCVTAARRLGLWVPPDEGVPHLALAASSRRAPDGVHAHWSAAVVARPTRSLVDPIENVLAIVAVCQSYERARCVWDSTLRHRLLRPEDLVALPWRGERALRLRDEATADSHSGLETIFVVRMRRHRVRVRQQVPLAGHRVDALVGRRVAVQIDGYAHHVDARQRRSDIAHDRMLQRLGFAVLRFDYHEVMNEWPRVESAVLRALARES